MRKFISLMLVVTVLAMSFGGCSNRYLDNDLYVIAYDNIMVKLEQVMDKEVYNNLRGYFVDQGFNSTYAHKNQVTYIKHFLIVLDDVLYELDQLGHRTKDPMVQTYQSKVEYALKDMRSRTNNLLSTEVMNSLLPNKNTLYRTVYRYLVDMNNAMLSYVSNEILLSDYLANYRQGGQEQTALDSLKEKNRMRYLYTYLMTASFIAPTQDYTGLHVHPDYPWVLSLTKTYHVYELSFGVLLGFRDFYLEYLPLLSYESKGVRTDEMAYFFEEIKVAVEAYETYYNVRKEYPRDFYTGDSFKDYQERQGNTRVGFRQDFREEYPDLIASGEAYGNIRSFMYNESLQNLMYEDEPVEGQ